jgi:hypothetical protein
MGQVTEEIGEYDELVVSAGSLSLNASASPWTTELANLALQQQGTAMESMGSRHLLANASRTMTLGADKTGIYSVQDKVEFNTNYRQCEGCRNPFQNQEALNQHQRQWTKSCARCQKRELYYCHERRLPRGSESYCQDAYGGCVQHKLCFMTDEETFNHHQERSHKRCYYEECTSKYRRKMQNDKDKVQKHVWEEHGGAETQTSDDEVHE